MPATLASLLTNDHGLRFFCDRCGRCVDLGEAHIALPNLGNSGPAVCMWLP